MIRASHVLFAPTLLLVCAMAMPPDGVDLVVVKQGTAGVVDGMAGGGEYPISQSLSGGLGSFQMQSFRGTSGDEELQFLFTITDNTNSGNDHVRIYFDLDHDHTSPEPVDREVQITRNGQVTVGGVNLGGAPSSPTTLPAGQVSVNPTASPTTWVAEVKILPADLGLNGIPSLSGLYIQAFNNETLDDGSFPATATTDVLGWANLKTRYPIDYVIVLDESGSMLSDDKWEDAKRAADFFANTMAILGEPSYFADRLGLVTFSWECFGEDRTAQGNEPLQAVGSFPVGAYTEDLDDPESDYCTPIGRGLEVAFSPSFLNATETDDSVERERGVLLLSDGLQNKPSSSFLPGDTGYDPCPGTAVWNACPAGTTSNATVNTVAFGEGDGSVDTDLLADIQARYLGDFATTFDLTADPDDLVESFINGLEDFYTTNLIQAGTSASASVDPDNEKLIVVASWSDPADAHDIELRLGSGTPGCDDGGSDTDVGFAFCSVENPDGGTWSAVEVGGGAVSPVPSRYFFIVDLRVRARFEVAPVQPETGDDLLLTVELRDRGLPVLHDPATHPVSVTVDVDTPEEGLGTFVVTRRPRTCERTEPQLPKPTQTPGVRGGAAAAGAAGAAAQGGGDPMPLPFALANRLFDVCDISALPRDENAGLELRDDGTGGDAVAGDGVYSLHFTGADVAGTYRFRFDVDGTTADGESFTRTKRLGTYVRVHPDPASSPFGFQVVQQSGTLVIREYYVLPRDQFGGYLGPGRAYKVDFRHVGGPGSFTGDVIDYGNGYYARRFQFDPTQGEPTVVPTVYGEPLQPAGPGPGPGLAGRLELGLFAGYTFFGDDLALDDGPVVGARVGLRVAPPIVIEAEGAVTFADSRRESGQVIQFLGGVRYDVRLQRLVLFASAGGGVVLFRGFGRDDEAEAYYGGVGAILPVHRRIGLRGDVRLLGIGAIGGGDASTNVQVTGGVIVRF